MGKTSASLLALLMAGMAVTHMQTAVAQNSRVEWSSVSSGFGPHASAASRVSSSIGEGIVGGSRLANTEIEDGFLAGFVFRGLGVAVPEQSEGLPQSYSLSQNYPNPFNPSTVIRFHVPVASDVRLAVYDILGREVTVLVNERKAAGAYEIMFGASGLASGMYVYRLQAGAFVDTKSLVLLK